MNVVNNLFKSVNFRYPVKQEVHRGSKFKIRHLCTSAWPAAIGKLYPIKCNRCGRSAHAWLNYTSPSWKFEQLNATFSINISWNCLWFRGSKCFM